MIGLKIRIRAFWNTWRHWRKLKQMHVHGMSFLEIYGVQLEIEQHVDQDLRKIAGYDV